MGVLGVGVVNPVVGIGMEDFETKKKSASAYSSLAMDICEHGRETHHDGKD